MAMGQSLIILTSLPYRTTGPVHISNLSYQYEYEYKCTGNGAHYRYSTVLVYLLATRRGGILLLFDIPSRIHPEGRKGIPLDPQRAAEAIEKLISKHKNR